MFTNSLDTLNQGAQLEKTVSSQPRQGQSEGLRSRTHTMASQRTRSASPAVYTCALQTDTNHTVELLLSLGVCPQNSGLGDAVWIKRSYDQTRL